MLEDKNAGITQKVHGDHAKELITGHTIEGTVIS